MPTSLPSLITSHNSLHVQEEGVASSKEQFQKVGSHCILNAQSVAVSSVIYETAMTHSSSKTQVTLKKDCESQRLGQTEENCLLAMSMPLYQVTHNAFDFFHRPV